MKHKFTTIVIFITFICVFSSCADLSLPGSKILDTDNAQIRRAENLIENGNYQEAAHIFWSIAETKSSPQREALQIRAAEAVLYPETKQQAQQYLSAINESTLSQDLFVRKRVASAELALINGQPQLALDTVSTKVADLSLKYKPHVLAVRAKALHKLGQIRESIATRITLNPLLRKSEQLNKNNQLIWQSLLNSNTDEIRVWANASTHPDLVAWLQLVLIQKQPHENLASIENELQQWRTRFPNHKIPNHIIASITRDWASFRISPNKIALLLPMTGRYQVVAEAIYAGISTAREFDETFNPSPELVLYDTGDDASVAASYHRRATAEGADFIIGPLQKEAVNILVSQGQISVPTLTLNYADDALVGPQKLFQFGLLPEDEAKQVAERASIDNYNEALALVPEGDWGTRLLEAFTNRFYELGGTVLQYARYSPKSADYSASIKNLLQLNQSEQRRRNIQAIIKQEVEFEPRRRQDVDFIFIAASPQQARQLRPQLSYHYASDLPVYATSHIFTGNENISADQDINGITYCDIPWLLSNEPSYELLRDSINLQATSSQSKLPRFAALGIDAYQVIPHLQRLAAYAYDRYDGVTGKLSIAGQNRIYRELTWAKFKDGYPQSLNFPSQTSSQVISQQ